MDINICVKPNLLKPSGFQKTNCEEGNLVLRKIQP